METAATGTATDARHSDIVNQATREVFAMTAGLELTAHEEDLDLTADGVIIAVISLVGGVEWSLFLGLPRSTAEAVAAKFAGFEIPFDSADMGDAVGELANILAGQVKTNLDRVGVQADISLPSVMRAQSLSVLIQSNTASRKTCFDSPLGKLWTGVTAGQNAGLIA